MFYTQLFTSKRGPLAKIWLAAHWERKLTKAQVFECDLETTVRDIISPKMTIGLRTSGHLLVGVVRIFSRKAKYLLADCGDALVKVQVVFRPGLTDLPAEDHEATVKAITLTEDFTAFDAPMPRPSNMDVTDHSSLNQSRSEEITLKEDTGRSFLSLAEFDESRGAETGLLDISFQSLAQQGDAFGDEGAGLELLDFLTHFGDPAESTDFMPPEPQHECAENSVLNYQHDADRRDYMKERTPSPNKTPLVNDEEEAFALEPVPVTPSSERKRQKTKRLLVVDPVKVLTNDVLRAQLCDFSDLLAPMDMAPPTRQLMQWMEDRTAENLFVQPCSSVAAPHIKELFARTFHLVKYVCEEVEVTEQKVSEAPRPRHSADLHASAAVDSALECEKTDSSGISPLRQSSGNLTFHRSMERESLPDDTYPEVPSEDSMCVHPSQTELDSQARSLSTQSVPEGRGSERTVTKEALDLLNALKIKKHSSFSLKELCAGRSRSQAATTFYCLLVLKKQGAVHLHQDGPYQNVVVTPGPAFFLV